ncbi:hypothetical protein [Priestia flexa]|uniref:hypothetical protein n=1 Tax=Priestia flexa TaxID=86664 RepID=UPI0011127419|nr:hypothetical protein [Priestia flexa]
MEWKMRDFYGTNKRDETPQYTRRLSARPAEREQSGMEIMLSREKLSNEVSYYSTFIKCAKCLF